MNTIQMIEIDKLQPHPDNPRKHVGDVSELADSIRHSGIMQNLTVVPHEGGYRVVIGHRRLAAAKEAGLTELPCVVSDMEPIEQLHTMMSENMQRKDLTPPEEAWGVQMLLDLGETPEAVQKKTGMSRTTFYHRKAMAALPADELQASYERGGTLADYVALEGIKDTKTKKRLLTLIGTNGYSYELQRAKENEAYLEKLNDALLLLEPVAKKLKNRKDEQSWRIIGVNDIAGIRQAVADIEKDSETHYTFFVGNNSWDRDRILIYGKPLEKKTSPEEEARKKAEKEREERHKALEKLDASVRNRRKNFLLHYQEADGDLKPIAVVFLQIAPYFNKNGAMEKLFDSKGDYNALQDAFDKLSTVNPGTMMLSLLINQASRAFDYQCSYYPKKDTMPVRDLLFKLGYKEDPDETAYWTGIHELFAEEEEEE